MVNSVQGHDTLLDTTKLRSVDGDGIGGAGARVGGGSDSGVNDSDLILGFRGTVGAGEDVRGDVERFRGGSGMAMLSVAAEARRRV